MKLIKLVFTAILGTVAIASPAGAREGLVVDVGLGVAEGNFDFETANDESDTTLGVQFNIGYAVANGFALTGGLFVAPFSYELQLAGQPTGIKMDISLMMAEIAGWYFHPIGRQGEVYGRVGLGKTQGTSRVTASGLEVKKDKESVGYDFAAGGQYFTSLTGTFAVFGEVYYRGFGLAFNTPELKDTEVATAGLLVGARWR
jgi:hypothetical protein